jgi:hypothetical protein
MIVKWAALLTQAAPSIDRAALLYNPKINPWYASFLKEIAASAPPLELTSTTIEDLRTRLPELARSPGLFIGPEAFMVDHMRDRSRLGQPASPADRLRMGRDGAIRLPVRLRRGPRRAATSGCPLYRAHFSRQRAEGSAARAAVHTTSLRST